MATAAQTHGVHSATPVSSGTIDRIICSCGWKSPSYWDGADWAHADWRKHVKSVVGQALAAAAPTSEPSP